VTARQLAGVPVVIFCGGLGIFADDSGQRIAKPLIDVQGKPLVSHVVGLFTRRGFMRFVLAGGYQADRLERLVAARSFGDADITVVDTGVESTTAQRLAAVATHLGDAEHFGVTYSDTLSDVDPAAVYDFHLRHGKIGTLITAHLPTRFKVVGLRDGDPLVRGFAAKPIIRKDHINGGFYFFRQDVLRLPVLEKATAQVTLEDDVLEALAEGGQLAAYQHDGAWQHVDSERDLRAVAALLNHQ
jgi:glucose-1-phosphate cytidylyltransferase